MDAYADDVVALADHLGLERFGFWGYSSAIDVGVRLAQIHPERLVALIGTGSVPRGTLAEDAQWARQTVEKLRQVGWELLLDGFDKQESSPVPDWMKEHIRNTDLQQFIDWLGAVEHAGWHYWDALPEVLSPSLFIVGELEDPDDETADAVARMPNATRTVLPGVGHIQSFLDSRRVLPVVQSFLAQHLTTTS